MNFPLHQNCLVEASAGTGKTTTLVARLAQGLLEEGLEVDQVAAVTFTRKAAGELRGRLRLKLEQACDGPEAERAQQVLSRFDELFVGTVHSFCGALLRQYPVEAGLGPDFCELEEQQDRLLMHKTLRKAIETPPGRRLLRWLQEMDATAVDLQQPLAWMCEHGEVDYPAAPIDPPETDAAWQAVENFAEELSPYLAPWDAQSTCVLFRLAHRLMEQLRLAQRDRPRDLLAILSDWETTPRVVKRYWGQSRAEQNQNLEQVEALVQRFRSEWVDDYSRRWQAYLYFQLVTFLEPLRQQCRDERLRRGWVNFHDLLFLCARLLRRNPGIRSALQQRLKLLCVDEFQDTDPLQAEIFSLLNGEGSLYLVGDPKQSIYRFRRADIETYQQAREQLLARGGQERSLQYSYRSVPELCQWVNRVFCEQMNHGGVPYQPLLPTRPSAQQAAVHCLPIDCERSQDVAHTEARLIAALIQEWCQAGAQPSDFLILTSRKAERIHYQRALTEAGIACQLGGEQAALSSRGRSLLRLLQVLARPDDRIALVGLLRGPLMGHSDPELFRHFTGQGEPEVEQTLEFLIELRQQLGQLPPGACLHLALEKLGLKWCLEAEHRGLVDALAACSQAGMTLAEACQEVLEQGCVGLPPQPQSDNGVRLLNLHKAKGLEAPVVFLAAPTQGLPRYVEHAVQRTSQGGRAAFCVRKGRRVLAQPADWESWERREQEQLEAEHLRLCYVAATRAQNRLVISRWNGQQRSGSPAWAPFEPFLDECPLLLPGPPRPAPAPVPDRLSRSQIESLLVLERQSLEHCLAPTWERHSVTSNADEPSLKLLLPPDDFSPGGAAWGDLIHRLLEQMVAHPEFDRAELRRLASWYAFDLPELQDHIETALDVLERIRGTAFWSRVLAARQRLVEIPFAHREGRQWLFGAIDLALEQEQDQGWDIVDYKTDRKNLDEMVARYAGQVQQYARSWREITREEVGYAGIYGVREGELSDNLSL